MTHEQYEADCERQVRQQEEDIRGPGIGDRAKVLVVIRVDQIRNAVEDDSRSDPGPRPPQSSVDDGLDPNHRPREKRRHEEHPAVPEGDVPVCRPVGQEDRRAIRHIGDQRRNHQAAHEPLEPRS